MPCSYTDGPVFGKSPEVPGYAWCRAEPFEVADETGRMDEHRAGADRRVRGSCTICAPCVLHVKQRCATGQQETCRLVLLTGDAWLVEGRGIDMRKRRAEQFSLARLHCFAERDGVGALQAQGFDQETHDDESRDAGRSLPHVPGR